MTFARSDQSVISITYHLIKSYPRSSTRLYFPPYRSASVCILENKENAIEYGVEAKIQYARKCIKIQDQIDTQTNHVLHTKAVCTFD